MPQLIRPSEMKIVTKDGEIQVSIVLDLNINLTTINGAVQVMAQAEKVEKKAEETQWAIPDFDISPRIEFGKREK